MKMSLLLASSKSGRVLLHSLCLLHCPAHATWHWQGILRELQSNPCCLHAQNRLFHPLTIGLILAAFGLLLFTFTVPAQPASTTSTSFHGVLNGANG